MQDIWILSLHGLNHFDEKERCICVLNIFFHVEVLLIVKIHSMKNERMSISQTAVVPFTNMV